MKLSIFAFLTLFSFLNFSFCTNDESGKAEPETQANEEETIEEEKNDAEEDNDDDQSKTEVEEEKITPPPPGLNCPEIDKPAVPAAAGQLQFSVQENVDPCSVKGYIVGKKDLLTVEKTPDGYVIDNVPAGNHDVVVQGSLAIATLANPAVGIRLDDIEFLAGVATKKPNLQLPEVGSIAGVATLAGQTDHAGIHVYIPGTGFDATTDSDGNYTIEPFVVPGIQNLFFEKDGYHRGQIEQLEVAAGSSTNAPAIEIVLSTGADGFLIIQDDLASYDDRSVSLIVGATDDAVLMKISEDNSFAGTSWQPIQTSLKYTFDTPGSKTLYIKFADANGLESSPFSDDIDIILFPASLDTQVSGDPMLRNKTVSFIKPENAVNVSYGFESDVSDGSPEQVGNSFDVTMRTLGTATVYFKFIDKDGFESPVYSETLSAGHIDSLSSLQGKALQTKWNGTRLMLWDLDYTNPSSAWVYDAATDTLTQTTNTNIPAPRTNVNIGTRGEDFFVWSGYDPGQPTTATKSLESGGIYDVSEDSWTASTEAGAPNPLVTGWGGERAQYAWTGSEILVYGKENLFGYDPVGDVWDQKALPGSSYSGLDANNAFNWTGSKLFIWGGNDVDGGGIYDYSLDSWTPTSTTNAPSHRDAHCAVWTGTEVIVWGGRDENTFEYVNSGARINVDTNTWTTMSTTDAIAFNWGFSCVWNGSKMLVLREDNSTAYDPSTDSWEVLNVGMGHSCAIAAWVTDRVYCYQSPANFTVFIP